MSSRFEEQAEHVFTDIEDALDEIDTDIDIDTEGGILTLTLMDDSSVIISRQIANEEIWIAARSGGYHLHATDADWICSKTGETLSVLLNRVLTEQAGIPITLQLSN